MFTQFQHGGGEGVPQIMDATVWQLCALQQLAKMPVKIGGIDRMPVGYTED
jgi:hypothetical protein